MQLRARVQNRGVGYLTNRFVLLKGVNGKECNLSLHPKVNFGSETSQANVQAESVGSI